MIKLKAMIASRGVLSIYYVLGVHGVKEILGLSVLQWQGSPWMPLKAVSMAEPVMKIDALGDRNFYLLP